LFGSLNQAVHRNIGVNFMYLITFAGSSKNLKIIVHEKVSQKAGSQIAIFSTPASVFGNGSPG
jgi:hypothetical protein